MQKQVRFLHNCLSCRLPFEDEKYHTFFLVNNLLSNLLKYFTEITCNLSAHVTRHDGDGRQGEGTRPTPAYLSSGHRTLLTNELTLWS
jgi:hypothetical protein